MGQYYYPVLMDAADNFKVFSPLHYDNGLKIMEHSWVGNKFVATICHVIGNKLYKVAWMGDYNDDAANRLDDEENAQRLRFWAEVKKAGEVSNGKGYCKIEPSEKYKEGGYYLLNFTKKEQCYVPMKKKGEWIVHPLPLLTSCAGSGGGDYHGELNRELIGAWAFDVVTCTPFRSCGINESDWVDLNEEYGECLFWEED